MMKRLLIFVLCLSCFLVVLTSCLDAPSIDKETTAAVESTEAESTEAESTEAETTETNPPEEESEETEPEETEPEETEPEETEPEETEPEETEPEETEPEETEPEETEPEQPEESVFTEALKDYTIVYPKRASATVKQAALSLQAKINELVGGTGIAVITDSDIPVTDKEILVGKTSRPASKAQYRDGAKSEFLLRNVDGTLVLAGYTDALTEKAVKYFEDTYLTEATDGKIEKPEDYTERVTDCFVLLESNASNVYVTYSTGWETVADRIIQKIKSQTGITLTKKLADSSYSYSKTATEIMVGEFGYAEAKCIANGLWDDGYVVSVNGPKLVLTAKTTEANYETPEAYQSAMEANRSGVVTLLEETLLPYIFYDGGICLPNGVRARDGGDDILQNIPGFSVAPSVVYPAGDGAYVALFRDVSLSNFNEYVEALSQAGFTQYSRTDFHGDTSTTKNYFATFVSDLNSVDIGYHTKGYLGTPDKFEPAYSGGILFVSVSPRDGLTLPLQEAPEYTPVNKNQYPTVVAQVGLGDYHPGEAANCYVIRLADGTFIVHDSAYDDAVSTADAIYNVLRTLAPDENNIVITAWITSHPHGDHMYGLKQFSLKYASYPNITVKQFVHNFADETIASSFENENAVLVRMAVKRFGLNVTVVKPRAGNVLYYANVKFNVLYTHENHLQLNQGTMYDGNASTMVMQMETDDGVKVLFGGDSPQMDNEYNGEPFTYNALAKRYGTFAESDAMTYFHHGLGGGSSWEANAAIKPKIVLWPITWGKIESTLREGTNLLDSSHSRYITRLTANSEGGSFEEGYLHDTPNYNGVYGWFIADNDVHVVNLDEKNSNGVPTVTTYETLNDFYNGNPTQ